MALDIGCCLLRWGVFAKWSQSCFFCLNAGKKSTWFLICHQLISLPVVSEAYVYRIIYLHTWMNIGQYIFLNMQTTTSVTWYQKRHIIFFQKRFVFYSPMFFHGKLPAGSGLWEHCYLNCLCLCRRLGRWTVAAAALATLLAAAAQRGTKAWPWS